MNKLLSAAVLAAGLLVASTASAATVPFRINAGVFGLFTGGPTTFINGTGSFQTAGDEGTFSLGSGLLAFDAEGDETVFEGSPGFRSLLGPIRFGLADLKQFSVTLSGGELTAISFLTGDVTVPLTNGGEPIDESDTLTFDVKGVSMFDFDTFEQLDFTAVTSQRYGDQGGSFFVDEITPGGDAGAVPEPATWAMLLLGMGAVGSGLRRRRKVVALA